MGIGMAIGYVGFTGTAGIEAEVAIQLLRLERYYPRLEGCNFEIELLKSEGGRKRYEARLVLMLEHNNLLRMPRCSDAEVARAVRTSFDRAVDALGGG